MLYEIVNDFPNQIIHEKEGPFISLYQETHRHKPENRQDLIRFKNLVDEIKDSLKQEYPKEDIKSIMKPFDEIANDRTFWNRSTDGLAILASKNKCVVYRLPRAVEELSIVANSFYIKPLIRNFQSAERYHVLGLDRENFKLFEGNRYGFEEIEFPEGDPITIKEVLGDEYTEAHVSHGSYGGTGGPPMYHGHGGRKDEIEIDAQRYFRYVDKYIMDNYSNKKKIPLILATLDEHYGWFKDISNNPHLYEKAIRKDYRDLSLPEIKEEAWKVIEPYYLNKTEELVERYKLGKSKSLASFDIAEISRAAIENRIDVLMAESGKIIPGAINKETGELVAGLVEDPRIGDLLNSVTQIVIRNKGEVVILPKERMPSETGLAAIYRY